MKEAPMLRTTLLHRELHWSRGLEGLAGVLLGAGLTTLGARIAVPVPGTPVPMTLQVLGVLLAGLILGGSRGAASQVLYLAAGLAGLPVFTAAVGPPALLGPTGGYLMAFPIAALVAGALAHRFGRWLGRVVAALSGVAVIYGGGMLWLALTVGTAAGSSPLANLGLAWRLGVVPFVLVDLAKGVLAALLVDRDGWVAVRRGLRRRGDGQAT